MKGEVILATPALLTEQNGGRIMASLPFRQGEQQSRSGGALEWCRPSQTATDWLWRPLLLA
jgi:hypothetical protein